MSQLAKERADLILLAIEDPRLNQLLGIVMHARMRRDTVGSLNVRVMSLRDVCKEQTICVLVNRWACQCISFEITLHPDKFALDKVTFTDTEFIMAILAELRVPFGLFIISSLTLTLRLVALYCPLTSTKHNDLFRNTQRQEVGHGATRCSCWLHFDALKYRLNPKEICEAKNHYEKGYKL